MALRALSVGGAGGVYLFPSWHVDFETGIADPTPRRREAEWERSYGAVFAPEQVSANSGAESAEIRSVDGAAAEEMGCD